MGLLSSIVSSVLPVASSVTSGLFNLKATDIANQSNRESVRDTNAMNYKIAQETNALNRDIADRNIAFQRENLEYQKALQQDIFAREDTAYERTVQDMRNAGLSPLSMSGTNGAGSVISTSAPNDSMQYMAPTMQSYQAQSASGAFDSLTESINSAINNSFRRDELRLAKQSADINNAKTAADTAAVNASTDAQILENKIKQAQYDELLKRAGLENADLSASTDLKKAQKGSSDLKDESQKLDNASKERKYNYDSALGIVDGMSEKERLAQIALKEMGIDTSDSSASDIKGYTPTTNGKISQTARMKKTAQAIKKIDTALGLSSWLQNLRVRDTDSDNLYYEGNRNYRHYDD